MKAKLLFVLLMFTISQVQAQEKIISGIVSDNMSPLPGVSIIIKGTVTGTETDFDGKYTIKAHVGDILEYSFVGMESVEEIVGASNIINVVMTSSSTLEEVVISGFNRKVEKRSSTFAVGSIGSSSRVVLRGASSILGLSSGKAAGVSVKDKRYKSKYIPQSGQLTAGEINDLNKWEDWIKILNSKKNKKYQENWNFYLENKVEVEVNDKNHHPINNAKVILYDNEKRPIMVARTDITGKVTLFKDLNTIRDDKYYTIQVIYNNEIKGKRITKIMPRIDFEFESSTVFNDIDVMFTIDATGSMRDEINYLKSELKNIINRLDKSIEQKRVALTFYRDHGDEYVVKDFDFSLNIDSVKEVLSHQSADGGGDYEEAVEEALKISMSKSWNDKAKSKLLFLLLDAPPHLNKQNVSIIKEQIKIAQEKGIKIIPIVASGADKNVEFLMRFFSVSTNGTYVFLTDDSGIGNKHLKPTASDFKIEKLNDLIVRLIEKYSGVVKV